MEDYSAKLTAEPFLYTETKIIGRYLLDGEDEQELKKRNIEQNLIKHKKVGSVKRVNSPIFRSEWKAVNRINIEYKSS